MIRPVVSQAPSSYHGNSIASDSMPMMFIGGGDRRSEERIKYWRKAVETAPTRTVRIEKQPKKVILSTLELSKKEKKTIWYTKKELGEMLNSNKELIQQSRRNPEANLCTRGLEDMMSIRASLNKKERRNGCLHAVLEEQKRQKAENMPNPEKLRKRSKNASKESLKRALQFAHMDMRAASGSERSLESSCDSLSLSPERHYRDVNKKVTSCDETVATMTTATTMSTVSTFETTFRRRGVDSVVQQPNTPRQSSSSTLPSSRPKMPRTISIDTNSSSNGLITDRKAKKLVLCPKLSDQ